MKKILRPSLKTRNDTAINNYLSVIVIIRNKSSRTDTRSFRRTNKTRQNGIHSLTRSRNTTHFQSRAIRASRPNPPFDKSPDARCQKRSRDKLAPQAANRTFYSAETSLKLAGRRFSCSVRQLQSDAESFRRTGVQAKVTIAPLQFQTMLAGSPRTREVGGVPAGRPNRRPRYGERACMCLRDGARWETAAGERGAVGREIGRSLDRFWITVG
ncbi:hypothetical protein GWI33_001030 [Rhynchophorus ferrugineus]|uniref:Uncharacterized protein n=1 Tax=Rhynchophorus ferrugineus TaxID=354439 RepID=A0A834MK92_RHYFE|nr:hypothetical protein GWI33_001030 [Rhynchophorus ferrugineus]